LPSVLYLADYDVTPLIPSQDRVYCRRRNATIHRESHLQTLFKESWLIQQDAELVRFQLSVVLGKHVV
jgi:hypothetical protein